MLKVSTANSSSPDIHSTTFSFDIFKGQVAGYLKADDTAKLVQLIKTFPQKHAADIITSLHASLFDHTLDHQHYQFIKCIAAVYPKLDEFLHLDDRVFPDRTILSPAGVMHILSELTQQGKINPETNIVIADSYDDFKSKFDSTLMSSTDKVFFLVRHKDDSLPERYRAHFTPIYMEHAKDSQQIHLVITDCNGAEAENFDFSFNLVKLLSQHQDKITTYAYTQLRQTDNSNCPVFTIRDFVKLQRMPNCLEYVKHLPLTPMQNPDFPGITFNAFDQLPASMTKVTQSLSRIEAMKSRLPEAQAQELESSVSKHLVRIEGKNINTLIKRRYLKYERSILKKAISETSYTPF